MPKPDPRLRGDKLAPAEAGIGSDPVQAFGLVATTQK